MSSLLLTLFIVMLLPYLAKAPLVLAMNREPEGYDNHNPRQQQARLTGFGQRANAAHYNSFEALVIYGCAVLAVGLSGQTGAWVLGLGWLFVLSRLLYLVCYWYDFSSMRSLVWLLGMVAAFTMAGLAVWGG
ncbi:MULTISPECIES: MAPEG family protein [Alkalimonas]|uniref:MAPEG family protein n=1 Tax=Alkalimonas mucilaginosa TaxID=3057676 RepID=A0ABU7JDK1_9GAMM|nr:MAPEG family protein [Alkalimonas sp. MEB004]MEE2023433.1 MAPEG family protein [Alkalimonas sp. MEB004]